ncbi:aminoacyl-tRNA hydrolase [Treponema sp. J25]|uniref:aminoacyl-tRNA hydrolase n=1 Tax=Treponema sp. J25 TaxID=2094121 RepID=UPI00104A61B3|nr:aminoacyl-tRNA hydrolase [Treponema sp. J25]TCW60985.1 aminoacyl-tRNA hydrolase [Treponema sp. J25]
MIQLVAFLGNPGKEYEKTRHNVGWLLAERLSFYGDLSWQRKHQGRLAILEKEKLLSLTEKNTGIPEGKTGGGISQSQKGPSPATGAHHTAGTSQAHSAASPTSGGSDIKGTLPSRIYFLFPETYMNLSGKSVRAVADFYRIPHSEILVVHDELELPFGTISLKYGGGLGGHNGLRSCRAELGTADFWRLRIGIGRPEHQDIAGYVLSPFTREESQLLADILQQVARLLEALLTSGPEQFVPEWNKKKVISV